jgi:indole-3-glycerol phosphate synthase
MVMSESSFLSRMRPLQEQRVREARARRSAAALEALVGKRPAPRDFAAALQRQGADPLRLIAEVKKASPSAGSIREGDPLFFARAMAGGGAAAISVLTEERYFKGSLDDLARVAAGVPVPVMRKDFLVDPYQLLEARAAGASAALLIVALLTEAELTALLREAAALGLAALVEVHDRPELEQALSAGAAIVGINNRNLQTLKVDTETTYALRALVPPGRVVVSESGQRTRADLDRLAAAGVDAVLIGEAIMRAEDVEGKVRELLGTTVNPYFQAELEKRSTKDAHGENSGGGEGVAGRGGLSARESLLNHDVS